MDHACNNCEIVQFLKYKHCFLLHSTASVSFYNCEQLSISFPVCRVSDGPGRHSEKTIWIAARCCCGTIQCQSSRLDILVGVLLVTSRSHISDSLQWRCYWQSSITGRDMKRGVIRHCIAGQTGAHWGQMLELVWNIACWSLGPLFIPHTILSNQNENVYANMMMMVPIVSTKA